jgi:energy-coupling factor transporter ATP-binding protein EcfA2
MSNDPYAAIAAALPTFEEEDQVALSRQVLAASRNDPPRGAPMNFARQYGEPEQVEPGEWKDHHRQWHGLPLDCPVTPLGKLATLSGTTYFFLDTLGEVAVLSENAGKGHITSLFGGRPLYLTWAWPRFGRGRMVTGYAAEDARDDLFAACTYCGTFELEDRVRGRGAWRDDAGRLIYHAGDAIWIDGKWKPPGSHGRYIYPGRPKIGRPAPRFEPSGDGSPGDVLLKGLRSWNWERPDLDPRLALGWLMTAMVGGALEQRPVIYVTGGEGSGKSTLQKLFRLLMNGALLATSNTTQAGIYQKVKQDSVAVMVDELEAKEDTRTTDKILELARVAYSGDKMQRGGKDGVGQEFSVMSSFLFSSIAVPAIDAQDASRMAILMLRERVSRDTVLEDLGLRDATKVQAIGRQLLKRMVAWFDRPAGEDWNALLARFKAALIAVGHNDRSADTFGALAAACHASLEDAMPDEVEVQLWQGLLKASELVETSGKERTWRRAFIHLIEAQPEQLRTNRHRSVGSVLAAWKGNFTPGFVGDKASLEDVIYTLKNFGMTISWGKDQFGAQQLEDWDNARLFIPAKHPGLNVLFAGTPWAGRMGTPGPWNGVLKQMPPHLWKPGKCDRGLDVKASGIFVNLAEVLAWDDAMPLPMAA